MSESTPSNTASSAPPTRTPGMWRFFVYSAVGIFAFFVTFTVSGNDSILLDHIVTAIKRAMPDLLPYLVILACVVGSVMPFFDGTWRASTVNKIFTVFKFLGLVLAIMLVARVGPEFLFQKNFGPFLMNSLAVNVGLLVPIGAVFLGFLLGYGLLEFVGALVEGFMRPVFRTPGRSAIDAVASFIGSYSLSLLITNRIYKEGGYTAREAAIISTGFSTVSATFMVVVATSLDLMGSWNLYFWTTLVVTFVVSAITVRLPPLSRIPDTTYAGTEPWPAPPTQGRLKHAWTAAREKVAESPSLPKVLWSNLIDGARMAVAVVPSILSIGLIGLILATYTPIFKILGYLFFPITWVLGLPDAQLASEAAALGISEMFLPAALVTGAADSTRFVIAIVCVSQVIFFSAMVPCMLATVIPVSVRQMVLIWVQRVALSLILAIPLAYLLVGR